MKLWAVFLFKFFLLIIALAAIQEIINSFAKFDVNRFNLAVVAFFAIITAIPVATIFVISTRILKKKPLF